MKFHCSVALAGANSSDAITEMLGVAAVVSFLGIAGYIVVVYLKESARLHAKRMARKAKGEALFDKPKTLMEFDDNYGEELERFNKEAVDYYEGTLDQAYQRFEDLVKIAAAAYTNISKSYGVNSIGIEGEKPGVRVARYENVCARQWNFFKSEMRYLSYGDVEKHLRHILESYKMMDDQSGSSSDEVEVSPEMLRSQEIVSLVKVVTKDRVTKLQEEMLKSIEPFKEYYERNVRSWLNDRLFKVVAKTKEKTGKGIRISDTTVENEFRCLRNSLEIVARLADRVSQNTQKIGEEGIALSQVVYVGTALNILSELKEWFPSIEVQQEVTSPEQTAEKTAAVK